MISDLLFITSANISHESNYIYCFYITSAKKFFEGLVLI